MTGLGAHTIKALFEKKNIQSCEEKVIYGSPPLYQDYKLLGSRHQLLFHRNLTHFGLRKLLILLSHCFKKLIFFFRNFYRKEDVVYRFNLSKSYG